MKERVVVFGIFDGLHEGHQFFLQKARAQGTELIVIVGRDEVCRSLKNKTPKNSERDRITALENHPFVSRAVLGDVEQSSWSILESLNPEIVCVGYDQYALEDSLKKWIFSQGKTIRLECISKLEKPDLS